MAGPLIPVIIGGQVIRMAAPTAMTLLRSGAARELPRMRDIGSQAAGANPSGPFYGAFRTNMPPPRFNPLGYGAAGLGGAGMMLADNTPPERRAPIPPSLFEELNARGAAGTQASPTIPANEEEPGYSGSAGRRLAGAILASQPQPGYASRPASSAAAPAPQRRIFPDHPMPPQRPQDSLIRRIFSGEDYQSSNALAEGPERGYTAPVVQGRRVNWGDSENAADFFRADRAARELGILPPVERASGGQVGQQGHAKPHKDAALVKALEIIERLMADRR